jgi:hypothetical protein
MTHEKMGFRTGFAFWSGRLDSELRLGVNWPYFIPKSLQFLAVTEKSITNIYLFVLLSWHGTKIIGGANQAVRDLTKYDK